MTITRNTKRDGYPQHRSPREILNDRGPRLKFPPIPEQIAELMTGSHCRGHGDYQIPGGELIEQACYVITVPGLNFFTVTHTTTEKAEALHKKIGMTRHAPTGRAKLGKKVEPVLSRIPSYTEEG